MMPTDYQAMLARIATLETKLRALEAAPRLSPLMRNVRAYGALGDGVADDTAAINAALSVVGTDPAVIFLPVGTYNYTGTIALSGKRLAIQGAGEKSVIQMVAQTGPALDFTGYLAANPLFNFGREFGNFCIRGDGVDDTANKGIYAKGVQAVHFHDISISGTGGIPLDLDSCYMCQFQNVLLNRPVAAAANDTPYLRLRADTIGNIFTNVGLRSDAAANDAGTACILFDNASATYAPNRNLFDKCWSEFMHIPENGSIVKVVGKENEFRSFNAYDTVTTTANTTNTCVIRFSPAGVGDDGGNIVSEYVNGKWGTTSEAYGVILAADRNIVFGNRTSQYGQLVRIDSGVNQSFVFIAGGAGANYLGANPTTITDNSGETDNVIFDLLAGKIKMPFTRIGNHSLSGSLTDISQFINDPQYGTVVGGATGTVDDLALYTTTGNYILHNPTGTLEVVISQSNGKIGFYGVAAISRAVLATGTGKTVDNIISALQNLGLVKQS